MECCRVQAEGFGLWLLDNPVEWLIKDQAFLLQGPLCHHEQRDAFRRRIVAITDSVTKQRSGQDNPWDNAGVVRLFETTHYKAVQWGYDKKQTGFAGPLGEAYHFLVPTAEDDEGGIIEESKEKSATVLSYIGARARHLLDRGKALLHRLGITPDEFLGNLQFHLNGNDLDDALGNHELWTSVLKPSFEELSLWAARFPRGHVSFVCFGSEECWRKDYGGRWDNYASIAKQILVQSGHPVIDPAQMYKGIGVSKLHFQNSWEDRAQFARSFCAQRRIATMIGVLAAGEKNAAQVLEAAFA